MNTEHNTCNKCGFEGLLVDFVKSRPCCKQCDKNRQKEYRDNNPEKIKQTRDKHKAKYGDAQKVKNKEYQKDYAIKNADRIKKRKKLYRELNKDSIAITRKKWLDKNPDFHREYRAKYLADPDNLRKTRDAIKRWGKENKERRRKNARENKRKKYHNDVAFKTSIILRSAFYSAVKNDLKRSSVVKLLGCSNEDFRSHIQSKFKDGMTWENWGHGKDKWNLDHILPIASFNMSNEPSPPQAAGYRRTGAQRPDTSGAHPSSGQAPRNHCAQIEEDQKKCWHYTNFQPLWHVDNLAKSDYLPCGNRASQVKETCHVMD